MEIIQCLYILPDKDNVSFYFLMKKTDRSRQKQAIHDKLIEKS